VLDEEMQRLPRKYRVPMVLCYLEGKTNEAMARHLNCPAGTIKTRLAKGRDLLRSRLEQRGVALSVGALAASLAPEAVTAAVSPTLVDATLRAATVCAAGKAVATAGISTAVAGLIQDVVRELFVAKLQLIAGVLLVITLIGAGASLLTYHALAHE